MSKCQKLRLFGLGALLVQLLVEVESQGMCGCEHRYGLLMDLYTSSNGSGWANKNRWGNMSLCSPAWYGVTCENGDVTSVSLTFNRLSGSLPSSWWNMSTLQYLYLQGNSLSGPLPAEWGNMSAVQQLYLNINSLSGSLPNSWGNMSAVKQLYLNINSLSGSLPAEWGNMSALQQLYLQGNSLSGSLPAEWGNMSALQHLYLNINSLSGSLPAEWGSMSALQQLYLNSNSLSGSLPAEWGNMSALQQLSLNINSLSGPLPAEWGNMSALQQLYLQGNSLSGPLPAEWGNMSALQQLSLNINSLSGSLPAEWGSMSAMHELYLNSNSLSGSLPAEWGNMSTLVTFYLQGNSLSGSLPAEWGNMSALQHLYLNINSLSGPLPAEWGSMSTLQQLYLNSNSLSGPLPAEWGSMSALQQLYLNSNSLSGPLPAEWGSMSTLQQLYLNSNSLSGPLPAEWGSMSTLQQLYLNSNSLSGPLPAEWGNMRALQQLYLNSNCLYGALPAGVTASSVSICNTRIFSTRFSCGVTDWAPTCRYVSESTTASLSPVVSTSSSSSSNSCSPMRSTTSVTSVSAGSRSTTASLSSAEFSLTDSMNAICLVQSISLVIGKLLLVNATELEQLLMDAVVPLQTVEGAEYFSSAIHTTNIVVSVPCRSIARSELLQLPQFAASMTFSPALPTCCRLENTTVAGQLLSFTLLHVKDLATDTVDQKGATPSAMSLIIHPPPNGWVPNVPLLISTTIEITILIECGPDSHLNVVLSVPAPGAERAYAGQVESAVKYSQIASLATVGATSASSLGRLMAVRSMVLCDADSVVGGGVVDLGLIMCEADGALVAARSAVVSNVVLIVAAAALLLALAAAWSLATHASLCESLLVLCVPSSLLPAWTAVVPSTSASAALLLGRLGGTPCAGTDAVLGLVGAVVALCPFAALAAFWLVSARGAAAALSCTRVTVRSEKQRNVNDALEGCLWPPLRFTRVLERRWRWSSISRITGAAIPAGTTRCAWVVLLEYRVLWYAALDSIGLAVIACVAVVSGLGGASLCRAWTVVALLLMVAQLLVVVIVQPFTTLFACVHAALSLGLTCLGALAQLVYVFVGSDTSTSGLWLVEASGGCSLAVVGVSAVKMALDIASLLRAVRRRVVVLFELCAGLDAVGSDKQMNDRDTTKNAMKGTMLADEVPNVVDDDCAFPAAVAFSDNTSLCAAVALRADEVELIELKFWDQDGKAQLNGDGDGGDEGGVGC